MEYINVFNRLDQDLSQKIEDLQRQQEELIEQKKYLLEAKQKVHCFLSDAYEIKQVLDFRPELVTSLQVELNKIFLGNSPPPQVQTNKVIQQQVKVNPVIQEPVQVNPVIQEPVKVNSIIQEPVNPVIQETIIAEEDINQNIISEEDFGNMFDNFAEQNEFPEQNEFSEQREFAELTAEEMNFGDFGDFGDFEDPQMVIDTDEEEPIKIFSFKDPDGKDTSF